MELDHLFICTSVGAPEAGRLTDLGLTEGQSNRHPGQGTACRRFFFHNAYLEFLWVHNEQEARNETAKPLRLWERWRYHQTGYSPFGIGWRPSRPAGDPVELPFVTRAYRPAYLPAPLQIDIAENFDYPAEPFLFHMSHGVRPDMYPPERRQPLKHSLGFRQITELTISLPAQKVSKALEVIEEYGLVKFSVGKAHLLEVTFDQGERDEANDFRPELPLVFHS